MLKPELTDHIPLLQVGGHYRLLTKRDQTPQLLQELEENGGVIFDNGAIPVVTNETLFLNRPHFLPRDILLSNKQIIRRKKKPNLVMHNVELDHFSLRVLVEPFSSEEDLQGDLPPIDVLSERLKFIIPNSTFVIN